MVGFAATLFVASLAKGTRKMYAETLVKFKMFVNSHMHCNSWFPASVSSLSMYISFMINKGYAVSTVVSNISALSFFHKLLGCHDPTSSFVVKKILCGAKKLYPSCDSRTPITIQMLFQLVDGVRLVVASQYEIDMFRAMFTLMFHAFLRIGEVTSSPNNIQFSQINVTNTSISITFLKFKHHVSSPLTIVIPANHSKYCPVVIVRRFIQRRGTANGPFFCLPGIAPVLPSYFSSVLTTCATLLDFSQYNIKPIVIGLVQQHGLHRVVILKVRFKPWVDGILMLLRSILELDHLQSMYNHMCCILKEVFSSFCLHFYLIISLVVCMYIFHYFSGCALVVDFGGFVSTTLFKTSSVLA